MHEYAHMSTQRSQRITANDILRHPWIKGVPPATPLPISGLLQQQYVLCMSLASRGHAFQGLRWRSQQVCIDGERHAPPSAAEQGVRARHVLPRVIHACAHTRHRAARMGGVAVAVDQDAGANGPDGHPHTKVRLSSTRLCLLGCVRLHEHSKACVLAAEPRRRDAGEAKVDHGLGRGAVDHVQRRHVEDCAL